MLKSYQKSPKTIRENGDSSYSKVMMILRCCYDFSKTSRLLKDLIGEAREVR